MEKQNTQEMNTKTLIIFAVMGVVGITLVVGYAFNGPSVEAEAQGGIEIMVTPHTGCQSIVIDGVRQLRCGDGLAMEGIIEANPTPAPSPIP